MLHARCALPALGLVLLSGAASAQAFPPSFKAGNVVVSDPDTDLLEEYAPDGTFLRAFGMDDDLGQAQQVVFGPHGLAYVACFFPGKVLVYDGAGAQYDEFTHADMSSARGLALSARGLYAASFGGDRVIEFDLLSGSPLRTFGQGTTLDGPVGLAVGTGGHVFVGSISSNLVHEFDVDGGWLRSFGAADAPDCTGLARGPDGLLWVASYVDGSILRYDADGMKVSETFIDPNGVQYFNFGPDGNLMVSNGFWVTHQDASGDPQHTFGGGHTLGGAVVPFRFKLQLSGTITETGEPARKVKLTKSMALTYWPGNGMVSIQFEPQTQADVTPALLDAFQFIQSNVMVFHGEEGRVTPTAKGRTFVGSYVPPQTMERGIGSVSLGITGKVVNGYWRPGKISGTFDFSRNGKTFRGSVKTKALLNG